MQHLVDIREARSLLLSRRDVMDRGITERRLGEMVAGGVVRRIRRGWYVDGEDWKALWPESRHLLHILAVQEDAVGRSPVFSAVSAAVLWGLPLYRLSPRRVHLTRERGRCRTAADVFHHEQRLRDDEISEVAGLRCTSLNRTVCDIARLLPREAAVACADAALRQVAVDGQTQDETIAAGWRAMVGDIAARSRSPGARQARWVIAFADGRAQLPGESVSRLQLHRLGFRRIGLQVPVRTREGRRYWIDFELEEAGAFGEFDGEGKYTDEAQRSGRTVEQVVLDEKRREDMIRGITGRRFVRWGSPQIRSPETLRARLAEFGVHGPR